MAFQNKVFISYRSEDRPWAKELHERLEADGFTNFWDKTAILAGQDWEQKILENLQASQHLVVLMSKTAKASDWVRREYAQFDALINSASSSAEPLNRRLIFVLLDEDDEAFNRAQKIIDFKTANPAVFPGDVANVVGTPLWERVIGQIEDSLSADPNTIPVVLGVIALTLEVFDRNYKNDNDFKIGVDEALKQIEIDPTNPAEVELFKARYGQRPSDWKPLDGTERVWDLLEVIKTSLNNNIEIGGKHFRWEHISEKFYRGSQVDVTNELNRLTKSPTVFVVDPVSLYSAKMVIKLGQLSKRFEDSDNTVFLVLPPIIPRPYFELMEMVKNSANQFWDFFYDSKVAKSYANCCASVCDRRDIGRMLRATLGPHVYMGANTVPQTKFG